MLEEADRFYLKAKDFHEDLAEALGTIVDYQRDLNHLCAADKNRVRTEPLFEKYDVAQESHPHNAWRGPHGVINSVTS